MLLIKMAGLNLSEQKYFNFVFFAFIELICSRLIEFSHISLIFIIHPKNIKITLFAFDLNIFVCEIKSVLKSLLVFWIKFTNFLNQLTVQIINRNKYFFLFPNFINKTVCLQIIYIMLVFCIYIGFKVTALTNSFIFIFVDFTILFFFIFFPRILNLSFLLLFLLLNFRVTNHLSL